MTSAEYRAHLALLPAQAGKTPRQKSAPAHDPRPRAKAPAPTPPLFQPRYLLARPTAPALTPDTVAVRLVLPEAQWPQVEAWLRTEGFLPY